MPVADGRRASIVTTPLVIATPEPMAEATDGSAYDFSRADAIDQVFTDAISNF
ncbi:hypothetical protein [Streptosporangium lutulentum]|uniref:Uncharacterized protein n=1 Tax=Streptosporangium lutulentum TaxID=1461250 RepID=A0ABT9QK78_9ACTN|nr:hypothetical protein [Streptosporangium lutulentum]MDP9846339.1 hypothetical protein [Streptosporangium lutulentum]